ncbi:uncharacterized protein [Henckelia pumila]|uniref:uncharacterized protein n=1 Tax=Henckelia pumila TaxID=405737 RepID=UPI003C6E582A
MYPKVKVREDTEEADQYAYERSSLQSLKAFEWQSLRHFSSADESLGSVVRIPRSYVPLSPPPSFHSSKEETNKKKMTDGEENGKNVRATSAPRPRAVLSSPDNDGIILSKAQTRRELLSGLKDHDSCQNRHVHCKTFSRSAVAESFAPTKKQDKESIDYKDDVRAKGRNTTLAGSSTRGGHQKRIKPVPIHD